MRLNKCLTLAIILIILTFSAAVSIPLKAQTVVNIIIYEDGSVTGTDAITQSGNIYTLKANISGNIQVQKSSIIINGAGYTLDGNGNGGIDLTNNLQHEPTQPVISNVTIENLYIINGGVGTNGGGNNTFYNDYISNTGVSIMLIGAKYNNITYCTLNSTNDEAIGMMEDGSYNTITENNIVGGVNMFLSAYETVDRNYWSDYLTKYPNATEIDNSGVGNTPYVYYTAQNIAPNGSSSFIIYQDNHPLMKPVAIPLTGSTSPSTTPNIPEFPSQLLVLTLFVALSVSITAMVMVRKRKIATSN